MRNLRWLGIVLLGSWMAACSDEPITQVPASMELKGNLCQVSVSDSSLMRMYRKVQATLPDLANQQLEALKADPGNAQLQEQLMISLPALFYLRPMQETVIPWLQTITSSQLSKLADVYVAATYYAYLQTGNKGLISDLPWEDLYMAAVPAYQDMGHTAPSDSAVLGRLMTQRRLEALTYLALEAGQDSLAKLIFDRVGTFQDSLHAGASETEQVLYMALGRVPNGQMAASGRDLFGSLLENGMQPQGGYIALSALLHVLTQAGHADAVMQMMHEAASLIPTDTLAGQIAMTQWLIRHVIGIRPDLDAPGMRRVEIHPHLAGRLAFAEGQLKTTSGLVLARWDKLKPLRLQYVIPREASLLLPLQHPTSATVIMNSTRLWMNGKPQPTPIGVTVAGVDEDGIYLRVAKDEYVFQVKDGRGN